MWNNSCTDRSVNLNRFSQCRLNFFSIAITFSFLWLLFFCAIVLNLPENALAYKLPDTGQTKCYDTTGTEIACAGTGQDGEYSINPMSYTDNGNGTITDNVTGLMWQKEDDNTTRTSADAGTYCDTLTLGGQSGYRLPSKKELITLVDYSIYPGPTINTTYFPNTNADYYWSSTTLATNVVKWGVQFYTGADSYNIGSNYYVRCVRGEQYPASSFTNNGNGTVTDNVTGLMWLQGYGSSMTWANALSYCEGLSLGGQSDWRLPNIKELASITDDTRSTPAIDTTYFPNAQPIGYWSSTTTTGGTNGAFVVHFGAGNVGGNNKSNEVNPYYRCVSSGQSEPSCNLAISPTSQTFTSTGGTGSVTVTASSCAWTATSNVSWITITAGSSGTGSGTVSYSVSANTSTSSRSGNMTIAGQTFTITQSAPSCTYTISSTSQSFTSSSGTGSVTVTPSASSCTWTATESLSWVSITSGSSGTGSGTVSYSVSANTSTSSRSGNMTIAGQTFTITQSGLSCTYTITPTSQTFTSTGGTGSITVTPSSSSCSWTATESLSWVSITSGSSGTGSGTVSYSVSANTSTSSRSGNMTIAGQSFAITQSGVTQNNCAATVSSSLVVHIPVITYSGSNYWADLAYNSSNGTLSLTNAGVVSDVSSYSTCTASSLTSDYKLHIPVLMLNGISYWADLQYNGSVFVITGGGQN